MLIFDVDGWAIDTRITVTRRPNLLHGTMTSVRGIVVHQTGASTAQSSLNSYLHPGANGAHFLLDKDGTIYQTGSIHWIQWHVGKLRSRCLVEYRCKPVELANLKTMGVSAINKQEMLKSVPDRFPSNQDSIGIELVGGTIGSDKNPAYETVTKEQNVSLRWLVSELLESLKIPPTEVFRHPQVSYKDPHEAESAQW